MSHENDKLDFSKKSSGVVLKDVTKIFQQPDTGKDFVAVDHINLEIKDGEMVTLLGPSGCGKTTTLRMISGFEYPTSGNVFIGERDVAKIPPNKRGISMVFQSYALFPHLNIWENIAYGLRVAKLPQDKIIQRTNNVVELMQLKGMESGINKPNKDLIRIPQIPASTIIQKIRSGEYSTKLSIQQYDKHCKGTTKYNEYLQSRQNKGGNPQSIISVSAEMAQKIIETKAGTGIIKVDRLGNPRPQEQVTCDFVVGKYYFRGEYIDTKKCTIHYGKKGSHIVPERGENYD